MVTGIDVAVMFQGQCGATFLGKNAETGTQSHPVSKGHIEELDKNASHVVADPFLKDLDKEIPVFSGFHAPRRHGSGGGPFPRLRRQSQTLFVSRVHIVRHPLD